MKRPDSGSFFALAILICWLALATVFVQGQSLPLSGGSRFQNAELHSSDAVAGDGFGIGLAISGDTVVVGAPYVEGGLGAAYVYVKPASGWENMTQTAKLIASDATPYSYFGWSVAMQGDTIVVGTVFAKIGSNQNQGAVYIFVKPVGGWKDMTETAKLVASDGAANDGLGVTVSISNGVVVAGAYMATTFGQNLNQGAAYVFAKPNGGWRSGSETAKLTASDAGQYDGLGYAVAVQGDTVLATAPAGYQGRAGRGYIYVKPAAGWSSMTQTAELTSGAGGLFGYSAGIAGDTTAIGSYDGPTYLFVKPAAGWTDATPNAALSIYGFQVSSQGIGLAMSRDTVIVGAPAIRNFRGVAFFFAKPTGGWVDMTQTGSFAASDGLKGDDFGSRVAYSGDTVVVSALVGDLVGVGKAYVFVP